MLDQAVFSFSVSTLSEDTFEVVSFTGREGISQIYNFDLTLISTQADVDAASVMRGLAKFTVNPPFSGRESAIFSGVITGFQTAGRIQNHYLYQARLQHKLWRMSLLNRSYAYVEAAPLDFLTDTLRGGAMNPNIDYQWQLNENYRRYEFVCQYNESDFAFLSRWLETLGIYYWFTHSASGGQCVIADSKTAHAYLPGHETCRFTSPSGMAVENPGLIITEFSCASTPLPGKVQLKSYNRQKPSLDLLCEAPVKSGEAGEWFLYGDNYLDKDEGSRLAQVRAQEILCRGNVFSGLSHNPCLRPGYLFKLEQHYRSSWNQDYLTVSLNHEGSQARQVVRAYGLSALSEPDHLFYRNSFTCIPATAQYRPARQTPWPKVAGAISALVDAEGSGQFAVLDSQGRYKILLPFDVAGRGGGKSSCWIPMMQPYGGDKMGFHAPLHKGTEVLVVFMDGNPDMPVIAGVVPNPRHPSLITDQNATQIQLHSSSGHKINIEDAPGQEHMLLASADGQTSIKIGKIG
jgi:type VI secretion system secreted protein VgrG